MFHASLAHHKGAQLYSLLVQSLEHAIIFIIWNYGEIIKVWYTETSVYTEIKKY